MQVIKDSLGALFDVLSVDATFEGDTQQVIFEANEQVLFEDQVVNAEYSITFKDSVFTSLERNSTVTIDGNNYSVKTITKSYDVGLTKATLSKA